MFPFTNSASSGSGRAQAPAPDTSFSFQYAGTIDSSVFESVPLNLPFSKIAAPLTLEIVYSFDPADYRTNDGGFGGFGFNMHVPSKNFGFEIQGSNPSNFFVTTYDNYRPDPMNPGQLLADRRDYQIAVWPPGTPVVRVTLDANLVPRLYFDGVEALIEPPAPPVDQSLPEGDFSTVYGYNGAPGRTVTIDPLKLVNGVIPPPGPV
jgi:hypothetical protein